VPRIEVIGSAEQNTRIVVRDWPDPQATFRVRSAGDRGRTLQAIGWGNFDPDCLLGHLTLHVENRDPLMITAHHFSDNVITVNRPYVLARLVLCAQAVATRLSDELNVGNGCLLWQLQHRQFGDIRKKFDYFEVVGKRHARLWPGKRYLRWCP
jgi:hypothetical protein